MDLVFPNEFPPNVFNTKSEKRREQYRKEKKRRDAVRFDASTREMDDDPTGTHASVLSLSLFSASKLTTPLCDKALGLAPSGGGGAGGGLRMVVLVVSKLWEEGGGFKGIESSLLLFRDGLVRQWKERDREAR